jgi:hypothetical protein
MELVTFASIEQEDNPRITGLRGLMHDVRQPAAKRPVCVRNGRRERKEDEPVARAHAGRFADTRGCAPPDVRATNRSLEIRIDRRARL